MNNQLKSFITENEGDAMLKMKRKLYDESLILVYGNVSKAARMLGVSRSVMNNYANKWSVRNNEQNRVDDSKTKKQ